MDKTCVFYRLRLANVLALAALLASTSAFAHGVANTFCQSLIARLKSEEEIAKFSGSELYDFLIEAGIRPAYLNGALGLAFKGKFEPAPKASETHDGTQILRNILNEFRKTDSIDSLVKEGMISKHSGRMLEHQKNFGFAPIEKIAEHEMAKLARVGLGNKGSLELLHEVMNYFPLEEVTKETGINDLRLRELQRQGEPPAASEIPGIVKLTLQRHREIGERREQLYRAKRNSKTLFQFLYNHMGPVELGKAFFVSQTTIHNWLGNEDSFFIPKRRELDRLAEQAQLEFDLPTLTKLGNLKKPVKLETVTHAARSRALLKSEVQQLEAEVQKRDPNFKSDVDLLRQLHFQHGSYKVVGELIGAEEFTIRKYTAESYAETYPEVSTDLREKLFKYHLHELERSPSANSRYPSDYDHDPVKFLHAMTMTFPKDHEVWKLIETSEGRWYGKKHPKEITMLGVTSRERLLDFFDKLGESERRRMSSRYNYARQVLKVDRPGRSELIAHTNLSIGELNRLGVPQRTPESLWLKLKRELPELGDEHLMKLFLMNEKEFASAQERWAKSPDLGGGMSHFEQFLVVHANLTLTTGGKEAFLAPFLIGKKGA